MTQSLKSLQNLQQFTDITQQTYCQAPAVWNKITDEAVNGRCKLHGGLSTGPKTSRGKEAIRQSNRTRKYNKKLPNDGKNERNN